MSDENGPLLPEHIFKRVAWRGVLSLGASLEQFTTWTITGVAAIVGLMVSNLDSLSNIVAACGIRWSLVLFSMSLLAAAISKQIGMAVQSGISTIVQLENLLNSDEGRALLDAMTVEPRQLVKEMAQPFIWPLSGVMRRAGERGLKDYVSGDKRMIRMFCWQLYFNFIHGLLTVAALVVLALFITVS